MTLDDWILALHLLSAFALVGALVLFWVLVVAGRNVDTPGPTIALGRLGMVGNAAVIPGIAGTIVFGVWLALSDDAYSLWDGWVIAAIVLWAIAAGTGQRAGGEYRKAFDRARELDAAGEQGPSAELLRLNRSPRGLLLHSVSSLMTLLILVDMIWEAGSMTVLADSVSFPLFVHVLGAMILVGGLLAGASGLALARGDARLLRLGYWSLLAVALPGYVLMWIGALWVYAREGLDDAPIEETWVAIGFGTAEVGGLLLLISLITGGIGVRKLRDGGGAALLKTSMVLSVVVLLAAVIAVWAMGAKPA